MRGISTELLYVIAFVAIGLLRYLWQRLKQAQPWEEALARQQRSDGQSVPEGSEPEPDVSVARQPPRPAVAARSYEPRPHEARPRRSVAPQAPGMRRAPKRFSREALFGDRRRTQDAVVAAAILGPCRASAPYDGDR